MARAIALGLLFAAAVTSRSWRAALPPSAAALRASRASVVPAGEFPKIATDPLGARVALPSAPKRIVSLALSADEMLVALVDPERIAGLTVFVDEESTSVAGARAPRSAARVTGEAESLLALEPDLVIASAYTRADALSLLEGAGVPVIGTGEHATLDDVVQAITIVGDAVGEPARAATLVASTRMRIDAVTAGHPARRPRVLIWEGSFTFGAGTLEDDVLATAGAINVAASLHGAAGLTEEAVIGLAPEIVLVPIAGGAVVARDPTLVGSNLTWRAVEAVQRGAVYGVPRAWIGAVSFEVVRALEAIAAIVRAEAT